MTQHRKRRRPYPPTRQPRKTVFSAALWDLWLAERMPDAQSEQLRAGIEEFRQRVVVGRTKEPRA